MLLIINLPDHVYRFLTQPVEGAYQLGGGLIGALIFNKPDCLFVQGYAGGLGPLRARLRQQLLLEVLIVTGVGDIPADRGREISVEAGEGETVDRRNGFERG